MEDHDVRQLRALRLLGTQERVPALRDVLDLVAGRIPLLVELKCVAGAPGLERAVVRALADYGGEAAVLCFRRRSLLEVRGDDTERVVGKLSSWPLIFPGRVRPAFRGCHVATLPSPAVQRRRAAGDLVIAWTVRSAQEEAWARRWADNVIFEGYLPAGAAGGHRLNAPRSAGRDVR